MAKPKKWSHLRNGTFPREIETYSDAIVALREEYAALTLEGALAKWNEWDARKDDLEAQLGDVNAHITALASLAFERMDASGVETTTVGLGRFSRSTDVSTKTTDKAALLAWFQAHLPDMVTVHSQTITSQTKLALESGADIPDGIEVAVRDRIKRTSA